MNASSSNYMPLDPPQPSRSSLTMFSNHTDKGRTRIVTSRSRKLQLLLSYLPDWIITLLLAAAFFALDSIPDFGYRRLFSLADTSLRHPYTLHERIPNMHLMLICALAPFVLQIIANIITVRSWWDFHNGTLGLVLALATTGSITQFTKISVGRPRPDIIARCLPPPGSVDPEFGLTPWQICTQTDSHIMTDGFRSFPSGHSSLSFAGLGFLTWYLAGKLHLFDKRGHAGKAWISLAPLSGAVMVAISRSMDYRHHWQDILTGSLLGLALSYFAYRQYYPSLASDLSHRPYSPRIKREDAEDLGLPTHHHHDSPPQRLPSQHLGLTPYGAPVYPPKQGARFERRHHEYNDNDSMDDLELGDTVRRGDPGPLEEVWDRRQQSNETVHSMQTPRAPTFDEHQSGLR